MPNSLGPGQVDYGIQIQHLHSLIGHYHVYNYVYEISNLMESMLTFNPTKNHLTLPVAASIGQDGPGRATPTSEEESEVTVGNATGLEVEQEPELREPALE